MAYKKERIVSLVREYERGKAVAEIAQESGIPTSTIYRWIREFKTIETSDGEYTPYEFQKLKKHSVKADHMLEVVRLSGIVSRVSLRKRLEIAESIHNSHPKYSVHEICEALEVDRGTFYNHIFRRSDTTWRDEKEHQLLLTVQQIFTDSGARYGANRISKTMNAQGISISKERVLNLMRELGIESIRNGAKRTYNQKREKNINRIHRDFSVNKPNKVWVSDITYFNCCGKPMFICVIIDLYSRMVVGYSISERESKQVVSGALKRAVEKRNPPKGLIFHSDRGGQYIAKTFKDLLKKFEFIQSLSAAGNPYDNAVAEAFFSTLKKEELYRKDYRSINEMKKAVVQYIDFYNSIRVHTYLGYLSPQKYEEKYYNNDNG